MSDAEEGGAAAPQVHIRLHPRGVVAPIIGAIHASGDVIRVALPAIAKTNFDEAQEPGNTLTVTFEGKQDIAARRAACTNWLLTKGFQDLARGVREALEEGASLRRGVQATEQDHHLRRVGAPFGRDPTHGQ